MEPLDKALLCLKLISERKAIDPVLFEVGRLTSITDYFLVTSGNSARQVQAISQHVSRRMKEEGFRPFGVEGVEEGHWVLMDYSDVIIHIFYHPLREFYDLEGLWIEAPRIGSSASDKKRKSSKQDL
jgi:ribosome-associated protein